MLALGMAWVTPQEQTEPFKQANWEAELESSERIVRGVAAAILKRGIHDPDVDDCCNETLRRAMEGRGRHSPDKPLRPWLAGIARHVAVDMLRRRNREESRSPLREDEEARKPWLEYTADSAPGADIQIEQRQSILQVRRALQKLPEDQRRALELFHLEGLGYREIAERLNVPLGTICTWVARGRKNLAKQLGAPE